MLSKVSSTLHDTGLQRRDENKRNREQMSLGVVCDFKWVHEGSQRQHVFSLLYTTPYLETKPHSKRVLK